MGDIEATPFRLFARTCCSDAMKLIKTLTVIATIILGWFGSVPTILTLPVSKEAAHLLVFLSGVFVVILVFAEFHDYWKNKPHSFKHERDTYPFMCNVVSNASPIIFSVRMSYAVREDVREVLRQRASEGDLTICLPRMVPFAQELKNLGATIYIYADEDFTPQSRFTIVRHDRGDAQMFYGHEVNGKFIIQHFRAADQEPAYFLARDLINIVKHQATPKSNL
jgi:hypothetical protein